MTLTGWIRGNVYRRRIDGNRQAYENSTDPAMRRRAQLHLWNEEWQRLIRHIPYYGELQKQRRLPERFDSFEQFAELLPTTTRSLVQSRTYDMASSEGAPQYIRMTGGTTAEPIQLPAWNSERRYTTSDLWFARGWYGLNPASTMFLLWGHSHLLGTGWRGWWNGIRRRVMDRMVGCHRVSAYDLQPDKLREAARSLIRVNPDFFVSYSVALDLFARTNQDLAAELRRIRLKCVIGAAEGFPAPDSAARLEALFDCPVAMEYGSVETSLVAHTHPRGGYQVFWRSYFVEAEPIRPGTTRCRIRLTSLYPRCFPLVRYEIGDEIDLAQPQTETALGVTDFNFVAGRCNDYVPLPDGSTIHSEVFTHAVRPCAQIRSYQVVYSSARVAIHYTASNPLSTESQTAILKRLGKVHPMLRQVSLRKVDRLQRTVAGKTRMVLPAA